MRHLSSISLVDLNSILVPAYMGSGKKEKGYTEEFTMGELHLIRQSCDHTIVCMDGPPYFRKQLFPAYKGTREVDEVLNQVKRNVVKELQAQGYTYCRVEGFEADDLLATLALKYRGVIRDIRLISSDKDVAQCLFDDGEFKVRGFDARTGNLRDVEWCFKKFGVEPKDMALYQALIGDSSDEYKGIPSWGPKQASQAIQKCGGLAGIRKALAKQIESCDETLKPLPNVWVKFAEHQGDLPMLLQLATLRTDVPVDAEKLLENPGQLGVLMRPILESILESIVDSTPDPEELKEEAAVMSAEDWVGGEEPPEKRERTIEDAAREGRAAIAEGRINNMGKETPDGPRSVLPARQQAMSDSEKMPKIWGHKDAPGAVWVGGDGPTNEQLEEATRPKSLVAGALDAVPSADAATGLALLRKPFPDSQVGKLPKPTKSQTEAPAAEKRNCNICGGWHHPRVVHLDYVGHAAVTNRLLEVDPLWSWEPMALTPEGIPRFDATGGMWIRMTVCGVTRIGYGAAAGASFKDVGSREKEVISDAIRNAAMRFGVALDLWSKQDLWVDKQEEGNQK